MFGEKKSFQAILSLKSDKLIFSQIISETIQMKKCIGSN